MATPTGDKSTGLTGSFQLFTSSKDLVMKNLNVFAILYALPFLLMLLNLFDGKRLSETNESMGLDRLSRAGAIGLIGFGAAIAAITVVLSIIVQIMTLIAGFEVGRGKKPTLKDLWEDTKRYGLRLMGLGIVVGLMFFGGLILLIVPGLIVLRRYYLSPYYLIDKDLTIGEAMRRSAADSKPFSSAIWGVIGVSILLSFVGILPLIGELVSFVLVALYTAAPPLRYLEIKRQSSSSSTK